MLGKSAGTCADELDLCRWDRVEKLSLLPDRGDFGRPEEECGRSSDRRSLSCCFCSLLSWRFRTSRVLWDGEREGMLVIRMEKRREVGGGGRRNVRWDSLLYRCG